MRMWTADSGRTRNAKTNNNNKIIEKKDMKKTLQLKFRAHHFVIVDVYALRDNKMATRRSNE